MYVQINVEVACCLQISIFYFWTTARLSNEIKSNTSTQAHDDVSYYLRNYNDYVILCDQVFGNVVGCWQYGLLQRDSSRMLRTNFHQTNWCTLCSRLQQTQRNIHQQITRVIQHTTFNFMADHNGMMSRVDDAWDRDCFGPVIDLMGTGQGGIASSPRSLWVTVAPLSKKLLIFISIKMNCWQFLWTEIIPHRYVCCCFMEYIILFFVSMRLYCKTFIYKWWMAPIFATLGALLAGMTPHRKIMVIQSQFWYYYGSLSRPQHCVYITTFAYISHFVSCHNSQLRVRLRLNLQFFYLNPQLPLLKTNGRDVGILLPVSNSSLLS